MTRGGEIIHHMASADETSHTELMASRDDEWLHSGEGYVIDEAVQPFESHFPPTLPRKTKAFYVP